MVMAVSPAAASHQFQFRNKPVGQYRRATDRSQGPGDYGDPSQGQGLEQPILGPVIQDQGQSGGGSCGNHRQQVNGESEREGGAAALVGCRPAGLLLRCGHIVSTSAPQIAGCSACR